MEKSKKIVKYLTTTQNPHQINVGDIIVTMEYTKTNKTFNQCMLNILKRKAG
jgi:co-chaperonin GroES (HSP10)